MGKITMMEAEPGDQEMTALLALVGERVRHAREAGGVPRRVLSEKSGVSMRYLAQLEAGKGNISIGLLQRLAKALDHPIEYLIGAGPSPHGPAYGAEAHHVAERFSVAAEETKAKIRHLLALPNASATRAGRICLIGLRGAGKSTLGRMAGDALSIPFVELNVEIEANAGIPISEIMALYGQEGFRKLEADALQRIIAQHDKMILAVGGGIVAEPATYANLLAHFHTIWVRTTAAEHMARVRAQGDERPMAGNPEAMAQLKSILTDREALYERAEAQLDTSGTLPDVSVQQMIAMIKAHGFLR